MMVKVSRYPSLTHHAYIPPNAKDVVCLWKRNELKLKESKYIYKCLDL